MTNCRCGADKFQSMLDEIEQMLIDASVLYELAIRCLEQGNHRLFAKLMHDAADEHDAVASLYEAMGNRALLAVN